MVGLGMGRFLESLSRNGGSWNGRSRNGGSWNGRSRNGQPRNGQFDLWLKSLKDSCTSISSVSD